LVRARCRALSLRHWDIGQHGVWVAWSQPTAAAMPPGTRKTTADVAERRYRDDRAAAALLPLRAQPAAAHPHAA
jgi:hypothetical protein